eukprot:CAMPEP_0114512094 /NCGR_PEP_ID=MMETSP0109-20121206/14775_1 /TAXON_ID=29199 /ORGANISM="Chlorarachnion reptans, Strain CCCM449" /LENGTH=54 /DNA_ID=CAMNT_0001691721 /DNA_START=1 /DNA_END=162 /DNA_ORIENTATION=+
MKLAKAMEEATVEAPVYTRSVELCAKAGSECIPEVKGNTLYDWVLKFQRLGGRL